MSRFAEAYARNEGKCARREERFLLELSDNAENPVSSQSCNDQPAIDIYQIDERHIILVRKSLSLPISLENPPPDWRGRGEVGCLQCRNESMEAVIALGH